MNGASQQTMLREPKLVKKDCFGFASQDDPSTSLRTAQAMTK
jgi:hypothetical protein